MYIDGYLGKNVRLRGKCAAVATAQVNLAAMNLNIFYGSVAAAAAKLDVTSSSALDTALGTGAQKIVVLGLDASYKFQAETITLNGTTRVQSAKSFLRVFCAEVLVAGTGFVNAGTIYVIKTGSSATYTTPGIPDTLTSAWLEILVGFGVGTSGIFTVPAGSSYSLRRIAGMSVGDAASVDTWTHRPTVATDNALKTGMDLDLADSFPGSIEVSADGEVTLEEKTDLYLRGNAVAATAIIDAMAWLERQGGDTFSSAFLISF